MITLTLAKIAQIVGGTLDGGADPSAVVSGCVEFDSRKVAAGGLFVCLPGERVDGHDYARAAVEKGAVAVLAARAVDAPAIVVSAASDDDADVADAVITAMTALATFVAHHLADEGLVIVGVTGSAGKTSTKDLLNAVLSTDGPTVAPPGSFNNEIGHPYTVLRCGRDTEYLVAEMSARGIGHIAHLARIAPPRIGVVLNVGSAHLGEFGSRENIARAKGELVEALPSATDGGLAILNADDPFVAAMASRTSAKVVYYSTATPTKPSAAYYATNIVLDDVARASFTLHGPSFEPQSVSLRVFGEHQVSNALAAAAAGIESGLPVEKVVAALNAHTASSAYRMDVTTRKDGLTIINDSYNANPESMKAAIAALAYTASARHGVRSVAVLGDMGELGDQAEQAHRDLGKELARFHVTHLVTVGGGWVNKTAAAARERGIDVISVDTVEQAADVVEEVTSAPRPGFDPHEVSDGDVVLIKASNAAQLWRVAELLTTPV